ncbi:hypothetical protein GUITHDRAFT_147826 [Guillardia theta CCMP2712]|uniref:Uncharacterized protein n=1 Tax=Guillardia theta (strain CCMP2712) TaxID=905079 RepID=L1IBB6_GUITC|nr:hypothetical protein GUITHDRAFT_147826 [Guillardia theta CCMP2712]EKX33556.1 hypothetical protein GUITHDRAFT_147826 [Guillardia theta CCMP2712]|eukprot:XP_005820536.1 hypothetical protein GUITHDRAFT_147826 [Guillardia theta CCMP2712]
MPAFSCLLLLLLFHTRNTSASPSLPRPPSSSSSSSSSSSTSSSLSDVQEQNSSTSKHKPLHPFHKLGVSSFRIAQAIGHLRPQQLVPAVSRSLHALEAVGMVYRTFDDGHYMATNEGAEISEETWQKVLTIVKGGDKENEGGEAGELEEGLVKRRDVKTSKEFLGGEQTCRYSRKILKRECTGYADGLFSEKIWIRSLRSCRKALVHSSPPSHVASSSRFTSLEFNPSSEYLLCGRGSGQLLIFKSHATSNRYVDEWDKAGRCCSLNAVRDVEGRRTIDAAHWNPLNRNEVGVSSRASDEVHTYDMKVCGSANRRRCEPTTILSHRSGQGHGGLLDFCFLSSSMVAGGTQSGCVLLWDPRSPKSPKGVLKQVWDIRAIKPQLSVLSLCTKEPTTLTTVCVEGKLPMLTAEGERCEGTHILPPDQLAPRSYMLEPMAERLVAFAVGDRCVGVHDLITGKLTHAYLNNDSDEFGELIIDNQRRRIAWISPAGNAGRHPVLVLRNHQVSPPGRLAMPDEQQRNKLTLLHAAESQEPPRW